MILQLHSITNQFSYLAQPDQLMPFHEFEKLFRETINKDDDLNVEAGNSKGHSNFY